MLTPKILHRVWLSDNIPDPRDVAYHDQLRALHPGWRVVDWNDDLVAGLPLFLGPEYRDAPTYVHRADIVMVELVYRFGGVAYGWDVEPVRCLEPLIGDSEGWCTPDADGFPGGGLFGAVPGHPAIRCLLQMIRRGVRENGWHDAAPHYDTGPHLWNATLGAEGVMPHGLDILGTTRTAYAIPYQQRELADDEAHMAGLRADPEVYAIHRFSGSWLGDKLDNVRVRRPFRRP